MLNHSCAPNAFQSFAGKRIVFRAIQPIDAGQEATISYVELAATRAERRAALLEGYCFDIDFGKVLSCSSAYPIMIVMPGSPTCVVPSSASMPCCTASAGCASGATPR